MKLTDAVLYDDTHGCTSMLKLISPHNSIHITTLIQDCGILLESRASCTSKVPTSCCEHFHLVIIRGVPLKSLIHAANNTKSDSKHMDVPI